MIKKIPHVFHLIKILIMLRLCLKFRVVTIDIRALTIFNGFVTDNNKWWIVSRWHVRDKEPWQIRPQYEGGFKIWILSIDKKKDSLVDTASHVLSTLYHFR